MQQLIYNRKDGNKQAKKDLKVVTEENENVLSRSFNELDF